MNIQIAESHSDIVSNTHNNITDILHFRRLLRFKNDERYTIELLNLLDTAALSSYCYTKIIQNCRKYTIMHLSWEIWHELKIAIVTTQLLKNRGREKNTISGKKRIAWAFFDSGKKTADSGKMLKAMPTPKATGNILLGFIRTQSLSARLLVKGAR